MKRTGGKRPGSPPPPTQWHSVLNRHPILVTIAGPNGAGKTTFFHSHMKSAQLRFLNADAIGRELQIDAYEAARVITELRNELVRQKESFVLETVFSDPIGDKVGFLKKAARSGYTVVLCFIGISTPEVSEERVIMRVSQGGHDVPHEKLFTRYPRTLANLYSAIRDLPYVFIFDNDDLTLPFRRIADVEHGQVIWSDNLLPSWLARLLPLKRD